MKTFTPISICGKKVIDYSNSAQVEHFNVLPFYGHIKSLNTSFHHFHYISDALNHSRYVHENQNGGILL
jgi:hypothetical protein